MFYFLNKPSDTDLQEARERRENDPEYQRAIAYDKLHGGCKAEIEYLNNYRLKLRQEKEAQMARIKELREANKALM